MNKQSLPFAIAGTGLLNTEGPLVRLVVVFHTKYCSICFIEAVAFAFLVQVVLCGVIAPFSFNKAKSGSVSLALSDGRSTVLCASSGLSLYSCVSQNGSVAATLSPSRWPPITFSNVSSHKPAWIPNRFYVDLASRRLRCSQETDDWKRFVEAERQQISSLPATFTWTMQHSAGSPLVIPSTIKSRRAQLSGTACPASKGRSCQTLRLRQALAFSPLPQVWVFRYRKHETGGGAVRRLPRLSAALRSNSGMVPDAGVGSPGRVHETAYHTRGSTYSFRQFDSRYGNYIALHGRNARLRAASRSPKTALHMGRGYLRMMFENFTEKSIKVIMLAQEEARRAGHNFVGTEQLFLGLVGQASGMAARVLRELGLTLRETRHHVELLIGKGSGFVSPEIPFTPRAKQALESALEVSKQLSHLYIDTQHLLLGVLKDEDGTISKVLGAFGLEKNRVKTELMRRLNNSREEMSIVGASGLDSPAHGGDGAESLVGGEKEPAIDGERNTRGGVASLFHPHSDRRHSAVSTTAVGSIGGGAARGTPTLKEYSIDLTEKAKNGELDPVVGRQTEIDRVVQILSRRTKSNPVLIGEPGVGKTAIAEGLAQRVVEGDVPTSLENKRLSVLDLGMLVAGTKYRGEFEERVKKVLEDVKRAANVILVIDEIHTLIGAGAGEGALDAANLLKPALARSDFQCIGATTLDEYKKYFEKDSALERRFQPILVNEPDLAETRRILETLSPKLETFHRVKYTPEALTMSARYSQQYIPDRYLPDKAIDLLDEAGSSVKTRHTKRPKEARAIVKELNEITHKLEQATTDDQYDLVMNLQDRYSELQQKLKTYDPRMRGPKTPGSSLVSMSNGDSLQRSLPATVPGNDTLTDTGKLDAAAGVGLVHPAVPASRELRNVPKEMEGEPTVAISLDNDDATVDKDQHQTDDKDLEPIPIVDVENVAEVLSTWTGISLAKLTQSASAKLMCMENTIHERVIGQGLAVGAVSRAIRRAKSGLKNPNRPIASFLFCGPTGVGKTELAKTLASYLFDSPEALVRLDMSEYMERFSVSKLLGSPPGYVGFEDGGQLTEAVRRKPYAVILMDEIEKAHPDVFNALLQILEDGRLTDAKGRTVDFKNTLIILTSNIGSKVIERAAAGAGGLGFDTWRGDDDDLRDNDESKGQVSSCGSGSLVSTRPIMLAKQSKTTQQREDSAVERKERNANEARYRRIKRLVQEELKSYFRPEFLNRLDECVVFEQLSKVDVGHIADILIGEVSERCMEQQKVELVVTSSLRERIIDEGFDRVYGARPLRRAVTRLLEDNIAEALLSGNIRPSDQVVADLDAITARVVVRRRHPTANKTNTPAPLYSVSNTNSTSVDFANASDANGPTSPLAVDPGTGSCNGTAPSDDCTDADRGYGRKVGNGEARPRPEGAANSKGMGGSSKGYEALAGRREAMGSVCFRAVSARDTEAQWAPHCKIHAPLHNSVGEDVKGLSYKVLQLGRNTEREQTVSAIPTHGVNTEEHESQTSSKGKMRPPNYQRGTLLRNALLLTRS